MRLGVSLAREESTIRMLKKLECPTGFLAPERESQ
jgi:hypothetical protein